MKLIIAGSRTFCCQVKTHDWKPQSNCLECRSLVKKIESVINEEGLTPTIIVSGRAKGADRLGELYGALKGLPINYYPANWDEQGKAAGMIRNQKMGDDSDAAVIMWNGKSRGSINMRNVMIKLQKPCFFFDYSRGEMVRFNEKN